jgi:mono/diheme cytochrome c family protein
LRTWIFGGIGVSVVVALMIAVVVAGNSDSDTGSEPSGSVAAQGDPVAGEVVFEGTCAACHGTEETGTEVSPPLVHQYYRPGHHSDASVALAVLNGVQPHHWNFGTMPPQPDLSGQDILDVTAYIRQIQEAAGIR